jgi:hypothetical protein
MALEQNLNKVGIAANLSGQNRWTFKDLINGVEDGDAVAMRQLRPVLQDIQTINGSLANYVQSSQFGPLFNQYRTSLDLQDANQVDVAIATALAGLPEPESRLASVAVKTVWQGANADLTNAIISGFGLTASDAGNIDDASTSCVLIDSPIAGETGLYQLRTNGSIQKLNAALFEAQMGYYTRFYVIDSSREFAIRQLDTATNAIEVEEIPYTDEYAGLGPIVVSNLNKTINFSFNAAEFVMGAEGFSLHPALKAAIDLIPGMGDAIDQVTQGLADLNAQISQQITDLTGQVTNLSGQVSSQGVSISALQTAVQAITSRLANAFANLQEILFLGGVPQVKDSSGVWTLAPNNLIQELSSDADTGIYRVNHGRGTIAIPQYFEANAQGEPQMACPIFQYGGMTQNSFDIRIEKYKPVLLVLPAGLNGSVFA